MPMVLGAADSSISTDVSSIVTTFTTGMGDVKTQALSLINTASPYLITIVAAVVVVKFGISLLKHFKA